MAAVLPVVDHELCDRCGLCVEACPCGAIEMTDKGPVFTCGDVCLKSSGCPSECGLVCEEVCPTGAISCSFEIIMEDDCSVRESKES